MDELNMIFKKNDNVLCKVIGDEAILVPIQRNVGDLEKIYTLNKTGLFIWNLLDGKMRFKEIYEAVINEFDVSIEEAKKDLASFLDQLTKYGIILKAIPNDIHSKLS